MANAKLGSHPSYAYSFVQTLDTAVELGLEPPTEFREVVSEA